MSDPWGAFSAPAPNRRRPRRPRRRPPPAAQPARTPGIAFSAPAPRRHRQPRPRPAAAAPAVRNWKPSRARPTGFPSLWLNHITRRLQNALTCGAADNSALQGPGPMLRLFDPKLARRTNSRPIRTSGGPRRLYDGARQVLGPLAAAAQSPRARWRAQRARSAMATNPWTSPRTRARARSAARSARPSASMAARSARGGGQARLWRRPGGRTAAAEQAKTDAYSVYDNVLLSPVGYRRRASIM